MPRKKKTAGQLLAAKREKFGGGRPAKPTLCRCGVLCASARKARAHCVGKVVEKRKAEMTMEQVFDSASVIESIKLSGGGKLIKLELAPRVRLLTGFSKGGDPWESTQSAVDFALEDELHSDKATNGLLKKLGMKGAKDFFLAYNGKRVELMRRFRGAR